jgi:hypothetical protein
MVYLYEGLGTSYETQGQFDKAVFGYERPGRQATLLLPGGLGTD